MMAYPRWRPFVCINRLSRREDISGDSGAWMYASEATKNRRSPDCQSPWHHQHHPNTLDDFAIDLTDAIDELDRS
jgi:hypothetical protein